MAEGFGVEDRGHFYDPVGALRDVVVNHLMQLVAAAAMEAPAGERRRNAEGRQVRAVPLDRRTPTRATTCAASTTATCNIDGVAPDSTHRDLRRAAARDRQLALGRACRGSSAPASACRSPRPRCGRLPPPAAARRSWSQRHRRPEPEPARRQARPVDRHPADPRRAPRRPGGPEAITLDMEFAERGRRGADAVRGAAARRDARRQRALHPPGRRRGDLADLRAAARRIRRRCTAYAPGTWGPKEAERAARRRRRAGTDRGWQVMSAGQSRDRQARGPRQRGHGRRRAKQARQEHGQRARRSRPRRARDRRARPRRRRSRRSPTTRSCRTATPARWWPPTARSTGCASRGLTRPSVFGTLLDREAGSFRLAPFGINVPSARIYEPGTNVLVTTWKTPPAGWWSATR